MHHKCISTVRVRVYTTLLLGLLQLSCCAASDSRDLNSEELPRVRGSVELPEDRGHGRPVAALLYSDGHAHLQLQELTLRGSFPTDVQLELREPPPEAALYNIGALDEPKVATGFLTMVSESHPSSMRYSTVTTRSVTCDGDCEIVERWCANELDCYEETRVCPDETPSPNCTLETAGDETLKQPPPWDLFAGVSENYVFVYVSAPLPAGSVSAALFGHPMGMRAGYHVLETHRLIASELSALEDCWNEVADEALARINAEDRTEYTSIDLLRPCADENSAADEGDAGEPHARASLRDVVRDHGFPAPPSAAGADTVQRVSASIEQHEPVDYRPALSSNRSSAIVLIAKPNALFTSVTI